MTDAGRAPVQKALGTDPFEYADITSNTYFDSILRHEFLFGPAQKLVGDFLKTFEEFPPRQKAASFSLSDVLEKLQSGAGSH